MKYKHNQQNLNIVLLLLVALSVLMFTYSNFIAPKLEKKSVVNVYVAKENIPTGVELQADMFTPIKVEKDSYIEGSVTRIQDVVGKSLKGQLKAGELLSTYRIQEGKVDGDGPLVAELKISSSLPLSDHDLIRVYVQRKVGGKNVVEELFHEKRVLSKATLKAKFSLTEQTNKVITGSTDPSDNGIPSIYVRVTDKEALEYLQAVNSGKLYIVKILDEEDKESVSNGKSVSTYPANIEDEENTTALYEVQEGETISDIADKFKTTEEKIAELNDGKTKFSVGQAIQVPGN